MSAGLRERKKERTHDRLARTALRLFDERGFDQVTVEEIAEACDVSARTFFRYFGAKEDVLFADGDAHKASLLDALDEQPAGLAPLDALEGAARVLTRDYADERAALQARTRVVRSTDSLRTRSAERQQRWEADLVERMRASGRADGLSELDLRLVVAATTTALRVAVELWLADDGSDDLPALLTATFDRLRAGLAG